MICIAVFSSPEAIAASIEAPQASATSCFDQSQGLEGSPSTETSIVTTPPPWPRMTSAI